MGVSLALMVNQPLNGPQDGVVRGHQFPQVLGHRGHVVRHQCLEVQVKFFLHYLKILTYASKVVPTNDHLHIRHNREGEAKFLRCSSYYEGAFSIIEPTEFSRISF